MSLIRFRGMDKTVLPLTERHQFIARSMIG